MRATCFFLLLLCAARLTAQSCDWMSLTDCGGNVNVRQMSVDPKGNVYIAGEYTGELLFHSALTTDTTITKYTDPYWHKTYVARYTAAGRLTMVVQFKTTGSNTTTTYVNCLNTLPNGDVVVFVEGGGVFVDAHGTRIETGRNGYGNNLYCIDSTGRLRWSIFAPVKRCTFIQPSAGGSILVYGQSQNEYTGEKCLLKLSATGTVLQTVNTGGPSLVAFSLQGEKLYVVAANGGYGNMINRDGKNTAFDMPKDNFGLFELDTHSLTPQRLFTRDIPVKEGWNGKGLSDYRMTINNSAAGLFVDMFLFVDYTTTFLGKDYSRTPYNAHLLRLDSKGNLFASISMSASYSNYLFIPGEDGMVYLSISTYGKYFRYASDSLAVPERSMFVENQVLMKMDVKLNVVWIQQAGTTGSAYHTTRLALGPSGTLYMATDIASPCALCAREVEIPWATEMALWRQKQ